VNPRPPAPKHRSSAPATLALLAFLLPVFSCNGNSSSPESPGAEETRQLRRKLAELNRREQILTAEYSLARNPASYIVVDLQGGNIAMRARGRDLRTFSVADVREQKRGKAVDSIWKMIEKKPLEKSERPQITPGAGEQATAEAAKQSLWGPQRMPSDYDLICEGDRVLEVRALPSSESGPRVLQWAKTAYRRSIDRYRTWRTAKTDKARDRIQLWLSEEDSRLFFWSLPKKLNLLVLD
jgi:hypothetical protein